MADVKISQLILMDSNQSLPITNAISDSDELIVNDISSLVTKRVKIHDIIYIRNRNIEDTPTGSEVTGDLNVTGGITFGTTLEDGLGNSITDFSTLITESILESILGSDGAGGIATLNCIRDSAPTRSGGLCGVTVSGELTVDSDLWVSGILYGDGSGLTNIQFALAADSADHARFSLLADNANQAENAVRADSAFHSITSDQTKKIETISTNDDASYFPTFVSSSSGVDSVKTDTDLSYNPNTNLLTAGFYAGDGSLLTNVTATSVFETSLSNVDSYHHILFRLNATGADSTNTDQSLLYNPALNILSGLNETDLFLYGGSQWTNKTNSNSATGLNYVMMKSNATGLDSVATDTGITYDATTETLSVTNFAGDGTFLTNVDAITAITATNVEVEVVNDDATYFLHIGSSASGGDGVNTSASLRYNPSTNSLGIVSDTNAFTLGLDSDLTIRHDGSNATIDNKTGALIITNSVGANNVVIVDNLPVTDPINAGQLWNDNGTMKISAGL